MAAMTFPVIVLLAGACQPSIRVVDPVTPASTVVPAAHALAVIGIDFDPPLGSPKIVTEGGARLLVAIENQGQFPELDIHVSAQLLDPMDRAVAGAFLNEVVVIQGLEPGEIRLVPFSKVTTLPVRGSYQLVVHVAAAREEADLTDNYRVYDILVSGAE